jgi:hypothetical protein
VAFTQADLDRLDQAIAQGGIMQSIAFADQTYVFRNLDEMLKLRSVMAQALAQPASRTRYAAHSKGL